MVFGVATVRHPNAVGLPVEQRCMIQLSAPCSVRKSASPSSSTTTLVLRAGAARVVTVHPSPTVTQADGALLSVPANTPSSMVIRYVVLKPSLLLWSLMRAELPLIVTGR